VGGKRCPEGSSPLLLPPGSSPNTQAYQFFDASEDPIDHHALWTFRDKEMQQRQPRMVVFDTESTHLSRLRRVNHKKLLKKLSEPSQHEGYFPFQFMPQTAKEEEQQEADPEQYLFAEWEAGEQNYALIDKDYCEPKACFDLWEGFYKHGREAFEDKVRKYLEQSDSLRLFTICSDADKLGFTNQLLEYVRDECPKRPIICTTLSRPQGERYLSECFLPLIGQLSFEVNLLVDYNIEAPLPHPYFEGERPFESLAPLLNSLYTPFLLKEVLLFQARVITRTTCRKCCRPDAPSSTWAQCCLSSTRTSPSTPSRASPPTWTPRARTRARPAASTSATLPSSTSQDNP
jgi:hypothetical protein